MKIRDGFVSNSSSSSFYVAVPTGERLNEDAIWEMLGVKKDSLAGKLLQAYVDFFKRGSEITAEQLMEDYGAENIDELKRYCRNDMLVELVTSGKWDVTRREASNEDGDGIGTYLHYADWDPIDTEKLKVFKYG